MVEEGKKRRRKTLKKEIRRSFSGSLGRFVSIACLVALGSFALVGLWVSGPDMRATYKNYANELCTADLTIIGDYGLDQADTEAIARVSGASNIEYGYMSDVEISGTLTAVRIFSVPSEISLCEISDGRMPETEYEIALAGFMSDEYAIGDSISFSDKGDTDSVLRTHSFTIVGFVYSAEIISSGSLGHSTAGTGDLEGYAVVSESAFDSDVYMTARIRFYDTQDQNPFSDGYTAGIQAHKSELKQLLADHPALRLASVKEQYQSMIDDGEEELSEKKASLSDAEKEIKEAGDELDNGAEQIEQEQKKLDEQVAKASSEIESAEDEIEKKSAELTDGEAQIADGEAQIADGEAAIAEAEDEISAGEEELSAAHRQLETARDSIESARGQIEERESKLSEGYAGLKEAEEEYEEAERKVREMREALEAQKNAVIDATGLPDEVSAEDLEELAAGMADADTAAAVEALLQVEGELEAAEAMLKEKEAEIEEAKAALSTGEAEIEEAREALSESEDELREREAEYDAGVARLKAARAELSEKREELAQAKDELSDAKDSLGEAKDAISGGEQSVAEAKEDLESQRADGKAQLKAAQNEWDEKSAEYEDALETYSEKEADAKEQIADAEDALSAAREELASLLEPAYEIYTRREIPGSNGYVTYTSVAEILDSLAKVFPIFLYCVAALVTLTTMTRFVDEERTQCGTLRSLGYDNRDIRRKFVFYGLLSSIIGGGAGILLGHTLFPLIVYQAYEDGIMLPRIEMHFHFGITLAAVILAYLSAVLPAHLVAERNLRERPAALLLPKPPADGSRILLERLSPLWERMSFTHKVTARNIFRYKKRMLMTVFGVCGSVSLLVAGLSVQHSIAGMNERQFGDIICYDLIVAEENYVSESERGEIESQLLSTDVERRSDVYYEELSKIAGRKQDEQSVTMLVTDDEENFSDYIKLTERRTKRTLDFSDDGVIISERLSELMRARVGDTITISDAENREYEMVVAGITEMYAGHFLFMNDVCYEKVFGREYEANAHLITLRDRDMDNTRKKAAEFLSLGGIKGVTQNTTLIEQIDDVTHSLDRIMDILILVAVLLAVVIMYNLTNINISERIRELSTIKVLGFYDSEVMMYIYRETILLTAVGIVAGFFLGYALYMYILNAVPPPNIMFNPALGWKAFAVPTVIVALITAVLGILVRRKMRRLNMLEALKSTD